MPPLSEAAGLLLTGALYTRRIGIRGPGGDLIFAGVKRGAFSLYHDDAPIYHFDLEGRWQRAFLDGVHYRKSLDNSVVAIDRVREGANLVLKRRSLAYAEVADLDAAVRDMAIALGGRVASRATAEWVAPPGSVRPLSPEDLAELLDRVARWDASAWFAHRERYLEAYGPIGFLPPDAHQSIILQATLGDARAKGFGGRPGVEHAERSPEEFAAHLRAVDRLLGRRVLQANAMFVGEGDFLRRPFAEVTGLFDAIASVFPTCGRSGHVHVRDRPEEEASLGGVDVFIDDLSAGLPGRAEIEALKIQGLRRINLGIESGDASLRAEAGARWEDREAIDFVRDAKAAGVALGVILLVGTGGVEAAARHVEATARLATSFDLGPGDLVYLIDAGEISPGSGPGAEAVAEQARAMRERLAPLKIRGAKVVPYSLEKQWN